MANFCRTFDGAVAPTPAQMIVGPIQGLRAAASSWSVVKVSGTGTVGSYSYQVSNDGVKYTEVESKSAEGNFPETSGALFHQVVLKTLPQSGTVVRVCIYAATVDDG